MVDPRQGDGGDMEPCGQDLFRDAVWFVKEREDFCCGLLCLTSFEQIPTAKNGLENSWVPPV